MVGAVGSAILISSGKTLIRLVGASIMAPFSWVAVVCLGIHAIQLVLA